MKNHLIWVIGLVLIVGMICGTLIYLNKNPYAIRFEIDDNTLEAVKSIDWESFDNEYDSEWDDGCYYPASCFVNDSEYLKQFPDKEEPSTICLYAIYCDGFMDALYGKEVGGTNEN